MPTPSKDETKEHFMSRCIPMRHQEHPSEKSTQSVAVCFSMWREHQKKAKASESSMNEDEAKKKKKKDGIYNA